MKVHRLFLALFVIVALGVAVPACRDEGGSAPASISGAIGTPTPWEALMNDRCTSCHGLNRIQSAHKSEAQWSATVDTMIARGAQVNTQEKAVLVQYLADNYK